MIETVLFDLDETLTDRAASLSRYAARFRREFAGLIGPVSVGEIEATFVALDERGYRPREDVYAGIAERLPWASVPDTAAIRDHWRTWFPSSAVARAGLHQTLAALAAAGVHLGVVTNGSVLTQSAKIAHLGIGQYFSTVVISEAAHCSKPDPRIFRRALEEIGCLAAATLFVGDHPVNDIVGSAEAGWSLCGSRASMPGPRSMRFHSVGSVRCLKSLRSSIHRAEMRRNTAVQLCLEHRAALAPPGSPAQRRGSASPRGSHTAIRTRA